MELPGSTQCFPWPGRAFAWFVACALVLSACGADPSRSDPQAAPRPGSIDAVVAELEYPPGFRVSVFASGIPGVRLLANGPRGVLTASVTNEDRILLLPDEDGDGKADRIVVFHVGIPGVHGIAWDGDTLYAAGTRSIWKLRDENGDGRAEATVKISDDLPPGDGHWSRTLVLGPGESGRKYLYVSAGSSCNICIERDKRRATVMRFPLSGGSATVWATGLRNSVGLAWRPGTTELWATENGRDHLGDDLPPDELNLLVGGGFYGWPFYYGKNVRDPKHPSVPEALPAPSPSRWEFQAHSAPLGIAFYDGEMFPGEYRGDAFVGFHGSWNRSTPTGYKVVRIRFKDGAPMGEEDFVAGFLKLEPKVRKLGRPVAPLVAPDGALLVSDDGGGRIYRITYEASEKSSSP